MIDQHYLETLVAKYRSTRSQGWSEAAAAHAEALCAAVERLVAEPTHANASAWYWSLKYSLAADSLDTRDRELAEARQQLSYERERNATNVAQADAQIAEVRAGKAEGRIQALESALRWAITEIRSTRFSHYIADRLEASVLPSTDPAVRTQALEQMLRRLTDRELSVDGLYRMMGEARALLPKGGDRTGPVGTGIAVASPDSASDREADSGDLGLRYLDDTVGGFEAYTSYDWSVRVFIRPLAGAKKGGDRHSPNQSGPEVNPPDSDSAGSGAPAPFTVGQRVRIKGATELYRTSGTIKRILGAHVEVVHPDGWSTYHGVDELEPLTAQGGS